MSSANAPLAHTSAHPTIVGINLGNAYSSIAVFTKSSAGVGGTLPQTIANEDGERQIASCVSWSATSDEIYIGNQAKSQLVKNGANSVMGWSAFLGKPFSSTPAAPQGTAPIIQHPTIAGSPAYKINTFVTPVAPTPIPSSTFATPAHRKIFTPAEVAEIFIRSLIQSASDFLGAQVSGAVVVVSSSWDSDQRTALRGVFDNIGVRVLQILDEASAALALTTSPASWIPDLPKDRTQLVVDVGHSSVHTSLIQIRDGLGVLLASQSTYSSQDKKVGGEAIDDKLLKHFSADFSKKSKVTLSLPAANLDKQDARAQAKLLLALEHTKRTISASTGAATISVESLKDGMDYTGSVNRMRFDLLVGSVYQDVAKLCEETLKEGGVKGEWIDEVVYLGGSASLPGLDESLTASLNLLVDDGLCITGHSSTHIAGQGLADPTTVLSRGAAIQAALIESLTHPDNEVSDGVKAAFTGPEPVDGKGDPLMPSLGKAIALVVLGKDNLAPIIILDKDTPLPARRISTLPTEGNVIEVWEVEADVKVERNKLPPLETEDGEPEEEEEEEWEETKVGRLRL
ncbi:actin-like ATPase domain-containing protein [Flagelloscypha sp. PMI_526]|nr:actin-like ATPase domain-containing protein [Flagelloscypha sp. PMI_526]